MMEEDLAAAWLVDKSLRNSEYAGLFPHAGVAGLASFSILDEIGAVTKMMREDKSVVRGRYLKRSRF